MTVTVVIVGGGTTIHVDPQAGGQIVSIDHRSLGNVLYWAQGLGRRLIERHFESSHTEWLRRYHGGWQVLLPNAGPRAAWNGMDIGFHGALAREPWSVVGRDPARVTLECRSWTGVAATRTIEVDRTGAVIVTEEVRHEGRAAPRWVHHPVFDVTESARIATGDRNVDQRVGAFFDQAAAGEQFLSTVLTPAKHVRLRPGFESALELDLSWSRSIWPFLWIWGGVDGDRRFLGVEPANVPSPNGPAPTAYQGSRARRRAGSVVLRFRLPGNRPSN